MDFALRDHPIEAAVDAAAAAAFAGAVAFAVSAVTDVSPIVAAVFAFIPPLVLLSRVERGEEIFLLPAFEIIDPAIESNELLLSAAMIATPAKHCCDELILDDVLERLDQDSRVVRLFDPRQMPTAGELRQCIDRHLRDSPPVSHPSDASDALSEALAQLRRSLH